MVERKGNVRLTREESEEAFRQAEASVFLEGYDLRKDEFFQGLKARVNSGEISAKEAGDIIQKHHMEKAKHLNS